MKLWIKVSLITVMMITLATSICSLLMVLRSGKSNLELAVQYTLADQQMRAASWRTAMETTAKNGTGDTYGATAQRSMARYFIEKFADENTILISGGDFIYNATQIDPQKILPVKGSARQYVIQDWNGSTLLFTGSNVTIGKTSYTLYVIKDIGSVYTGIRELSYQFTLVNLTVILIAGGIVVGLVRLVLRPVSKLKQNTGLIAAGIYNKRIEVAENDEVGELAADFNQMAAAIETHVNELQEEADRRTLFMSALTHELKTPMTSISGNAQTLLCTKMEEDEREEALIHIHEECTRMERLSQKLLQLIVLQQKESVHLEPHRVDGFLNRIRASCQEQLSRRGLTLAASRTTDFFVMDEDLLSSLLLNLIDNAGKASNPGDTIELSIEENTITVKDHGKGIPPEEIGKITQPFYMVDKSRSKKAGGIGLGLALAEQIARLHGAKLLFESVPGEGTTVKVVFGHA